MTLMAALEVVAGEWPDMPLPKRREAELLVRAADIDPEDPAAAVLAKREALAWEMLS